MTEEPKPRARDLTKAGERRESPQLASGRVARVLRLVSAATVGLAISTAVIVVALRLIHWFQPALVPWTLKSAVPLMLIGISFASMQFVLPRTRAQILLSLIVALAFILWGAEQFVSNRTVVSLIDDIVVFLFVLDLSLVIYGHVKPGLHPVSKYLPFDEPEA
jgi:hypothetical protein